MRESREVRLVRARIAKLFVEALISEKKSNVRALEPRSTGLDEWLRMNERRTRDALPAFLRPQA